MLGLEFKFGNNLNLTMWQNLSITWKFGLLYLFLMAFLATFGAVVISNVSEMRRDADRLLEETREHTIAQGMMGHLSIIESFEMEDSMRVERGELRAEMAIEQVDTLFTSLSNLRGSSSDPSRPEHQAVEDRHIEAAIQALSGLRQSLASSSSERRLVTSAVQLKAVRSCIRYFVEETREEVEHSDLDLEQSARAARSVTVGTIMAIAIALCIALALVYRTIIAPLQTLREGADRFGSGDLEHRIDLCNSDELGMLAMSFNTMADRISLTQSSLEDRIAERTRELIRAGRLADIGILAAGVAHEINTPLASIAACAEGLSRRTCKESVSASEVNEYLETIISEAYRAHKTTQQLLALSRQDHGEVEGVSMELVLDQVEKTVKPLLDRRDISLTTEYELKGVQVKANAGEMIQILVNLIINAKDASPRGASILFRCHGLDNNLVLEVQDRGCGIAPEDIEKVFSPFYTTKGPGKGTGLGLSLAANIVEMRSGRISVVSHPESGTCFRVELPMRWKE